MLDEEETRRFYLDFLGYSIDWEHRFNTDITDSPLYMQISLGESVIHLDGHADEESPIAEVRVPVRDLEDFCEHLGSKDDDESKPEVVDPRYSGRLTDMNLVDPSGNLIVFWSPERLAKK